MARKRKGRAGRTPAFQFPISDEELIARLEVDVPDSLSAVISEAKFDAAVEGLIKESPLSTVSPHSYCRKCSEYHLKTHPHFSA
jgi:hypothetical protein